MDLSKSYEFFQPEKDDAMIHIIGCGSVGSTIAENLARCGVTKMTLYDFDKVEKAAHPIDPLEFGEIDPLGKRLFLDGCVGGVVRTEALFVLHHFPTCLSCFFAVGSARSPRARARAVAARNIFFHFIISYFSV